MRHSVPVDKTLVPRALDRAHWAHRDERRKVAGEPYLRHVLGVVRILMSFGPVDDHLMAACVLHDVVEHGKATLRDIEREFGLLVAYLVEQMTPSLEPAEWGDRKAAAIEELRCKESMVVALACADKLDNLISLREDQARGLQIWDKLGGNREEQEAYHRELAVAFSARLAQTNWAPMAEEFRREVNLVFGRKRDDESFWNAVE